MGPFALVMPRCHIFTKKSMILGILIDFEIYTYIYIYIYIHIYIIYIGIYIT